MAQHFVCSGAVKTAVTYLAGQILKDTPVLSDLSAVVRGGT